MNNNLIKKNIILSVAVILMGLVIAGGTFAWLVGSFLATNNTYNVASDCFLIDYNTSEYESNIQGNMISGFGNMHNITDLGDNEYKVDYTQSTADTYMIINSGQTITNGKSYVLQFTVAGLNDNDIVSFGLRYSRNGVSSIYHFQVITNGINKIVFNYEGTSVNYLILDDIANSGRTAVFTMSNFYLYEQSQDISGTMFPSAGPSKGLKGSVSLKINDTCSVNGYGTLNLNILSNTSTKFSDVVSAHCENPLTLETLNDYNTSSDCTTNGGIWVENGTALKYVLYEDDNIYGTPLAKGYVTSSMIGSVTQIYDNFLVNSAERTFYIYLWLDGYLSDNTYTNLPFDASISANGVQRNNVMLSNYSPVSYIHFSGSQYIDTGVSPSSYNGNYTLEIEEKHFASGNDSGTYIMGTNSGNSDNTSRASIFITKDGTDAKTYVNKKDNSTWSAQIISNCLFIDSLNYIKFDVNSSNSFRKIKINTSLDASTEDFVSKSTTNFRIGGYGSTPSYVGDIYTVRIYGNGQLVRNMIPCYRNSDNAAGFYDTVSGSFYTADGLTYG